MTLKLTAEDVRTVVDWMRYREKKITSKARKEERSKIKMLSGEHVEEPKNDTRIEKLRKCAVRVGYKVEIPIETWREVMAAQWLCNSNAKGEPRAHEKGTNG